MRFTGQIRVPEVDHPGVPATFVVDDNQAEVILEGESLGRWSLFDVHVTRLVSSAFQVDLAGEEITFLADEPVDFAYKGVEHMAEVWARYKTMTVPRRVVAVKRSRKGTSPSRIQEFHNALVQNLRLEREGGSGSGEPAMMAGESAAAPVPPPLADPLLEPATEVSPGEGAEAVIPLVGESVDGDEAAETARIAAETARIAAEAARIAADRAEAELAEAGQLEIERKAEAERMTAERESLAAERALLEEQKRSLDEALAQAELLEKDRLEAARLDMEQIDNEKRDLEEQHQRERLEAERLEAERQEIVQLEAKRVERERQQSEEMAARELEVSQLAEQKRLESERLEEERQHLERLEAERLEKERLETERLEAARAELEKAEREQAEAARLEMERLEQERLELERLEQERLESARAEAERLDQERLEREQAEAERLEKERLEEEQREKEAAAAAESEVEPVGRVAEVLGTSAEGDLAENSKELVVDLGAFEEPDPVETTPPDPEPEPALAGVAEKSGIMGAVKAAFTRNGKNHVHDFTEAPGGIGMVRYICRECGYVSISSSD